jgi:hypothetical protein
MTSPTPSTAAARSAFARLTKYQDQLRSLRVTLQEKVQEINMIESSRMTVQGLADHKAELISAAHAELKDQLGVAVRQAAQDFAVVRAWDAAHRPQGGQDELSFMKEQRAWERVRQLLDAGRALTPIIAQTADLDTLLAIRQEVPTWLQAQSGLGTYDLPGLLATVDRRMAQLTTGDAQTALLQDLELPVIEARTSGLASSLAQQAMGFPAADQLAAALDARYREQALARDFQMPESAATV